MMTSLEQLETLRRQVEEDYKLDMAAIDRLQRRFNEAIANGSTVVTTSVEPQPAIETRSVTLVPAVDLRQQPPDQLKDSLRTMFSNYR
jgi:hypothetical protein